MYLNNKETIMKLTSIVLISILNLLIVACGGGGGESDSSTSTPPVLSTPDPVAPIVDAPVEVEVDPNATYETTAELVVARAFIIEQEYELTVSYKNDNNLSAYLSVCTEFTEGKSGIKVNYNSCLLRTSIESDYAGMLKVANDKNRLVMAIWYLNDTDNPRYEIWENDSDAMEVRKFEVN